METIPFLLLHLYVIAQLLLLPIAYLALSVLVAKNWFSKSRTNVKAAFFFTATFTPIALLANGYVSFRAACNTAEFDELFTSPIENVDGFLVRHNDSRYDSQAPLNLLKERQYQYFERKFNYKHKHGYTLNTWDGRATRTIFITSRQSRYDFEVTPPEPVSPIFKPGFQVSRVKVLNAINGEIIAQSTEFVYGGGLIGKYVAYLFNEWRQADNAYSCGYIDRNIHLFRSNSLHKEYLTKDRDFINKTLAPHQARK
ncbi:hypothetical protein [Methylogaea oryzae]|uniref:hypothetical protein n=1 Tax=Methylogaea oryzae TaxID=1295382 RepID=UPI0012E2902E|nr:hypothetical protein [Methylogaea oryzae]